MAGMARFFRTLPSCRVPWLLLVEGMGTPDHFLDSK